MCSCIGTGTGAAATCDWCTAPIVGLAVLAVALVVMLAGDDAVRRKATKADPDLPMPQRDRRLLAGYLLALSCVLGYVFVTVFAVEIADVAAVPRAGFATVAEAGDRPYVAGVIPRADSGGGTASLTVRGARFDETTRVRIGYEERKTAFVDKSNLVVPLQPADLTRGGMLIDVIGTTVAPTQASNAVLVEVTRPVGAWVAFGQTRQLSREVQLLILVLVAGALGSYVHAIQSFVDFSGNGTLRASWFWWYLSRPFLGGALALVFYAALRGGFLASASADARSVNAFGVVAMAALVGMFSDKATLKLSEVFDTLFKADDTRGGKLSAPTVTQLVPATIKVGTTPPPVLRIVGERMATVTTVRLGDADRKPGPVADKLVQLQLTADDVAKVRDLAVSVSTADGATSTAATLHVSNLELATTALGNAPVNQLYRFELKATGGQGAYTWTLSNAPKWLQVDAKSGILGGTPDAKGTMTVTVTVADELSAAVSKELPIVVG